MPDASTLTIAKRLQERGEHKIALELLLDAHAAETAPPPEPDPAAQTTDTPGALPSDLKIATNKSGEQIIASASLVRLDNEALATIKAADRGLYDRSLAELNGAAYTVSGR